MACLLSKKMARQRAIITKIDGDNYTVKYADGTEATVAKTAVGLKE